MKVFCITLGPLYLLFLMSSRKNLGGEKKEKEPKVFREEGDKQQGENQVLVQGSWRGWDGEVLNASEQQEILRAKACAVQLVGDEEVRAGWREREVSLGRLTTIFSLFRFPFGLAFPTLSALSPV